MNKIKNFLKNKTVIAAFITLLAAGFGIYADPAIINDIAGFILSLTE